MTKKMTRRRHWMRCGREVPRLFTFFMINTTGRFTGFVSGMLGNEDNARDAFQESFIRVFEHRKEFRGNNFSSWLFTNTRHTCLNYLRSRKDFDTLDKVATFCQRNRDRCGYDGLYTKSHSHIACRTQGSNIAS